MGRPTLEHRLGKVPRRPIPLAARARRLHQPDRIELPPTRRRRGGHRGGAAAHIAAAAAAAAAAATARDRRRVGRLLGVDGVRNAVHAVLEHARDGGRAVGVPVNERCARGV